ncbi:MAG TPA: hypothetical protein VMS17_31565 [Gemmataceae bacterium]|nr:hypothetical protein [Gemmataceae bacterium]
MPFSVSTAAHAHAIETSLIALDYLPGLPLSYGPTAAAIDRAAARRTVRPLCKRRGLTCKHYHRGPSVRAVAVCCCGFGEEL